MPKNSEASDSSEVSIVRHADCRVCGGNLEEVADFGKQKIISLGDKPSIVAPLVLMKCQKCGLVQLRDTVNKDFLFRHYYYRSGATKTMRDHLKGIVEDVNKRISLRVNDIVIDIGSNDGTLLSFYDPTLIRVGFDPAHLDDAEYRCPFVRVEEFFTAEAFQSLTKTYYGFEDRKARVVSMVACFYDLEDPNAFLQDVKKVLAPDGLLVLQVNYLPAVLKNNSVGDVCHEHLEYYSMDTLAGLIYDNDLMIDDASFNDINGGSMRVFVRHKDYGETSLRIKIDGPTNKEIQDFKSRVERIAFKLRAFIDTAQATGSSVALVGASTRVATLIQLAGLDGYGKINYVVERDASKVGKSYLGIPIIGEEEDKMRPADYYILGPTWFTKEVMERMPHVRRWIIPLPEPRAVIDGKEMLL